MSDFFDNHDGNITIVPSGSGRAADLWQDARLRLDPKLRAIRRAAQSGPKQRVLVVGVEVPSRGTALADITARLARSRHHVDISCVAMQPKGKFENVDDAIAAAPEPLASYDWLVITDDDVGLPEHFLDDYLAVADAAGLVISQPAHRYRSYATYAVTRRRARSLARQTGFVEIGPLTVIRQEAFAALIPFPPSRWAYGIDVLWADIARRHGWRMGVVDALPIRHLRPVAAGYDIDAAIAEGRNLLRRHDVRLDRRELFRNFVPLL